MVETCGQGALTGCAGRIDSVGFFFLVFFCTLPGVFIAVAVGTKIWESQAEEDQQDRDSSNLSEYRHPNMTREEKQEEDRIRWMMEQRIGMASHNSNPSSSLHNNSEISIGHSSSRVSPASRDQGASLDESEPIGNGTITSRPSDLSEGGFAAAGPKDDDSGGEVDGSKVLSSSTDLRGAIELSPVNDRTTSVTLPPLGDADAKND